MGQKCTLILYVFFFIFDPEHRNLLSPYSEPYKGEIADSCSTSQLNTLPISACGLHVEDNAVHVADSLRLGCTVCEAHTCPCGATVDPLCQHALSCNKNAGRVQRHAWINDLIYRALIRAEIPAVTEPQSLRNDGKRPDGLTLVPWQSGRSATWDAQLSTHGSV